MRGAKKDIFVHLIFFLVTLAFFYQFLSGDLIFAFKDMSRYFYPLRQLMVEQVRSGILPLWNPYLFCGYPFLASLQVCFFYPLSLIHYLLPFDLAFNYYTMVHYFLASSFTYYLMRHFKASRWAALFSGLTFAFSGYLLSAASMNTTLSSLVWLPLLVLMFDRLVQGFKLRIFLLLVLFLTCMLLGGEPTIVYAAAIVLTAYAFYFGSSLKDKWKAAAYLFLALVFVFLLSAAQLFPFFEFAQRSDRVVLNDFGRISSRSFPIREIITFVLPYFFGNMLFPGSYNSAFLGDKLHHWLISPYFGFIPLFLAVYSLRRADKRIKFWTVVGILGLILSFGRYTPLFHFLYKFFPGVALIRFPVKYLFIPVFSTAFLAGAGFDLLLSALHEKKRLALSILSLALGSGLVYVLAKLFQQNLFGYLVSRLNFDKNPFSLLTLWQNLDFNIGSLLNLAVIIFLFGSVLLMAVHKKITAQTCQFSLVAILLFDLFSVNSPINIAAGSSVQSEITGNISFLLKDKTRFRYCLTDELSLHNRMAFGEDFNRSLLEAKDKLVSNRSMRHGLYDYDGYESMLLDSSRMLMEKLNKLPLDQRLKKLGDYNVKYIVSLEKLKSGNLRLVRQSKEYYFGEIFIYQNKFWRPAAYMSSGRGQVEILKYTPDRVVIKAEVARSGALFLSDSYYPGWRVYVDGREEVIREADYRFREVTLMKGEHRVVFCYEPLSFRLGLIVSSLALLFLAGAGVYSFKKTNDAL